MSTDVQPAADARDTGPLAEGPALAVLPEAGDVRELLNGLFDRPVTVREETVPVLRGRDVHLVAAYVADAGALRAVVMCDLVLGCCLGAALALLPMPQVQAALDAGRVPTDLADNTQEVLNIASSLFNAADAHLKLRDVAVVPTPVADDVVELLRGQPQRVDLTVEVSGYGTGVLAVLLTQPPR